MKRLILMAVAAMTIVGCRTLDTQSTIQESGDPDMRRGQERAIRNQVGDAASALTSVLFSSDALDYRNEDMQRLIRDSQCIVSMQVTQGAFIFGGGGGNGLMTCRHASGGWSAPSFVRTGQVDISAAIGVRSFSIGMFITDPGLAESYKSNLNFSTTAYAEAIAADASAALRASERYGMAVFMKNEVGLYAGVGLTVRSMSHMMAQRNQVVYQNLLNGTEPTTIDGRACSSFASARRRNRCIAEWEHRTGLDSSAVSARDIFELRADEAPQLTKPFNDTIRQFDL